MDSLLHRGLTSAADLATMVELCRDWPGSVAASRATGLADGRAESPGETLARLRLIEIGLPAEDLQIAVALDHSTVYGDLGWRSRRVLMEFDGKRKFDRWRRPGETPADTAWRERRRELDIERAGWVVIRICWWQLFDLAVLRAIVLEGFARAAARGLAA